VFEISRDKPVMLVRFNPNVPLPETVFAVTVHVVPEPVTLEIEPTVPVFTKLKFEAVSPVSAAAKVTVQLTVEALVDAVPARAIEEIAFIVVWLRGLLVAVDVMYFSLPAEPL
jgi:hypothetical protein